MSSSSELDVGRYLEALKELLRERGVTYAQLAAALHCSLPTVKRAFNKPSLSLSRLLEFCEVAQIAFGDLHQRAEQRRPRHFVFTEEQDQLFCEREEFLEYFLELATQRTTPFAIAKRHNLDQRSSDLYVEQLVRIGLIELQGPSRVKIRVMPPFGFGPHSRVLANKQAKFMKTILSNVTTSDSQNKHCVAVLKPLRLSEEDYRQLIEELENIIHRFAAIAERGLSRGSTSSWQVALACGPAPAPEPKRLPRISH